MRLEERLSGAGARIRANEVEGSEVGLRDCIERSQRRRSVAVGAVASVAAVALAGATYALVSDGSGPTPVEVQVPADPAPVAPPATEPPTRFTPERWPAVVSVEEAARGVLADGREFVVGENSMGLCSSLGETYLGCDSGTGLPPDMPPSQPRLGGDVQLHHALLAAYLPPEAERARLRVDGREYELDLSVAPSGRFWGAPVPPGLNFPETPVSGVSTGTVVYLRADGTVVEEQPVIG